jgi:hypothetical protein
MIQKIKSIGKELVGLLYNELRLVEYTISDGRVTFSATAKVAARAVGTGRFSVRTGRYLEG